MHAIINTGGRQLQVAVGDVVQIDHRSTTAGERIQFDRVVLYHDGENAQFGAPTVDGIAVAAEVVAPLVKGRKIKVQKFRRRKADSKRARGHRQRYTRVRITGIGPAGELDKAAPAKAKDDAPETADASKED